MIVLRNTILIFLKKKREIIESAEAKRQEIINSGKYLSDKKNYRYHPESFYTSRLLNESIQQAESLLNLSSTEIGSKIYYIKGGGEWSNEILI